MTKITTKNFNIDNKINCDRLSEIQEYLRNKGYIVVAIPNLLTPFWDGMSDLKWCWHVIYEKHGVLHDICDLCEDESEFKFDTYEEALEVGLNEALEIYKQ